LVPGGGDRAVVDAYLGDEVALSAADTTHDQYQRLWPVWSGLDIRAVSIWTPGGRRARYLIVGA